MDGGKEFPIPKKSWFTPFGLITNGLSRVIPNIRGILLTHAGLLRPMMARLRSYILV